MIGAIINQGPSDWEIIQQENGQAQITLGGTFSVPDTALNVGVDHAVPVVRVVSEEDNSRIIPWTPAQYTLTEPEAFRGTWSIALQVPAGGLYRIETGVDSAGADGTYVWMFRGDLRFHIGVGNIFVIAGQSNAAGFGQDPAADAPQPGVHVYRGNGSWNLAVHPLNESTDAGDENSNTEIRVTGTSPFLSFGKMFRQLSGCPVGLVPAAKGGSPIDLWDKDGDGMLYRNMLRKLRLCGGKTAGILWYQGCADTVGDAPHVYEKKYRNMIRYIREDLGRQVPFFTFQINRELSSPYDEGWGIVREVHRQVACDTPDVYILPTLNCSLCDDVHNNSGSNVLLGERMGRLCAHVLYGAAEFAAPDIERAAFVSDQELILTFSHAEKGFLLNRKNAGDCGFSAADCEGRIPLGRISCLPGEPGRLSIEVLRTPGQEVSVSFCDQAVPSFTPPLAAVTYLPPLAFYRYPASFLPSAYPFCHAGHRSQ